MDGAFSGVIEFVEATDEEARRRLDRVAREALRIATRYLHAGFDFDQDDRLTRSPRNLERLRNLAELDDLLVRAGYGQAVEALFAAYPELGRRVRAAWRELGIPAGFTTSDLEAFNLAAGAQADRFANIGAAAVELLKSGLIDAVTIGASEKSTVEAIAEVFIGRPDLRDRARHAGTLVTTAVSQLHRTMNARLGEHAGIERWGYFGRVIESTRPFCRVLDGQVLTREQIDQLDNGQTGPGTAFVAGGGFNCRHVWVPVVQEETT